MDAISNKLPSDLASTYAEMTDRNSGRDKRHKQVSAVRRGDVHEVMPGVFPASWPKPIVANVIDTTAKDLARVLARMPAIDCSSGNMTSEKARQFASKRTKIALHYLDKSRVESQFKVGCDWYFTFSAMPIVTEPDFDQKMPKMRIDDPRGAYWTCDAYGNVREYCKTWDESIGALCGKFPEHTDAIMAQNTSLAGRTTVDKRGKLKVARLYTKSGIYMFLPDRGNLLLKAAPNRFNRVMVEIAQLPSWDGENRGHFDDVMWVWLARARMALYGMEAADKSIRAPLAVPMDVQKIPMGSDALIRSSEADKIRRVPLDLPQAALIESQLLQQEVAQGTSYPSARAGTLDASIITGKGVEALAGVFSTQISAAQDDVSGALRRSLMNCFEMDQAYWPSEKKTMDGRSNGVPFSEQYTPAKDINGDYTVSVTYGFTAGMDPNRALVFLLQLRGDRAIDRETLQRQLPFETDTEQLNQSIDIEEMEDALKQGLFATLQSMGPMIQQGMDPTKILQQVSAIVAARQKGKAMYEAVVEAFTPPPAPPQDPMAALGAGGQGGDQQGGMGGQDMGNVSPTAGPLAMQPGASPDLQTLLAGLSSRGTPDLAAAVKRRIPA